jgi:hypothetical protein
MKDRNQPTVSPVSESPAEYRELNVIWQKCPTIVCATVSSAHGTGRKTIAEPLPNLSPTSPPHLEDTNEAEVWVSSQYL